MNNTWVFGDVHGMYDNLVDIFNKVDIQKGDRIISLGDIVDRGDKSFECVQLLIDMKNDYEMIFIKGNHDDMFYKGLLSGDYALMNQGAKETLESYINNCNSDRQISQTIKGWKTDLEIQDLSISHFEFFKNQLNYFVDADNRLFVHGGFNRHYYIDDSIHNDDITLMWDRDLLNSARSYSSMKNNTHKFKMKNEFKEVFVGHTPTQYFDSIKPVNYANIWDIDTGCGKYHGSFGGLTIMNVNTKEYYTSNL